MKLNPRHFVFICALLALVPGCSSKKSVEIQRQPIVKPPITVWIHGTRFFTRMLPASTFGAPAGLHAITTIEKSYHNVKICQTLCKHSCIFYPEFFYLFGWSGYLSFKARRQAAQELYAALKKIVRAYLLIYNERPYIRIITHSHGGNVALNLAEFLNDTDDMIINELILLACPVQECTKNYIDNPKFEKIYSLYSPMDSIQVADPQKLYKDTKTLPNAKQVSFFSERLFPDHPKLVQAKILNGRRGIMHIEYLLSHFVELLPKILEILDEYYQSQPLNRHATLNLKQLKHLV